MIIFFGLSSEEGRASKCSHHPTISNRVTTALKELHKLFRLYTPESSEVYGQRGRAEALLQPRHRGGAAALGGAPVNAAESQQVQHDGQEHN